MTVHSSYSHRLYSLDCLRGFAVLLMIIYHFFYDYGHFGYWQIDLNAVLGWRVFRYTIMSLFLLLMGMSLALQHQQQIVFARIIKRCLLLGGASMIISMVSFWQFPDSWIYFGMIHFIFVASLCGLFFCRLPNVCLILAAIIIIASAQDHLQTHSVYEWIKPMGLPVRTEDLVPLFPWFGVVLLGIYLSHYRLCDLSPSGVERKLQQNQSQIVKSLLFMGRHSLLVYLIHQPILFTGFLSIEWLLKK